MNKEEIYKDLRKKTLSLSDYLGDKQKKVLKAFDFAWEAHKEQVRKSGEPYFIHLFETAKTLMEMKLDEDVVSAGFLHDSVEDVGVSLEELEKEFGKDVAFLVNGVTKLGHVRYHGLKRHNESLKKLFIATAKDLRVILIKFADRLHNIKTLEFVKPEKRLRIATETLDIYAQLANRLGVTKIARQLEDYSFKYVQPEEYQKVVSILAKKRESNEKELEKFLKSIKKKLAEWGITKFKTAYRVKGIYSYYKKLVEHNWQDERIYDVAALRIIVDDVKTCYEILGYIHQSYKPVPGRIKDYIGFPKPNGYQSLHTTVFTGYGSVVEIQIRTEEMHRVAELGVASHISYKEKGKKGKDWIESFTNIFKAKTFKNDKVKDECLEKNKKWINDMVNEVEELEIDDDEKLETYLSTDFLNNRIFVFTPKGDVIDLPVGSTATDFAFAVHTDLGFHIIGAKINGDYKSIDTELKEGDIVEVVTKENSWPTQKWLEFLKTSLAIKRVKNFLAKQRGKE